MKRFDISVVGELNADLILYGLPQTLEPEREHLAADFSMTLGSSSAIFAHNLSLLGSRVGFTSCIGDDPLGKFCVGRLRESGVDVSEVKVLAGKTTGVTVILPLAKQRRILTYLGTTLDLQFAHLDLNYLRSASHFHLSSFFLLRALRPRIPELFSQMKKSGLTTSLDTNDDPEDLWADDVKSALNSVDIFLPNEREACKLAGTADVQSALDVLSQLVPIVVIKCGPEGGLYIADWTDTGECHNYDKVDATNGRIYRVTYGMPKPFKGDIAKLTDAELIKLQLHANDWLVRQARRQLLASACAELIKG